jgi:hypothetical protein
MPDENNVQQQKLTTYSACAKSAWDRFNSRRDMENKTSLAIWMATLVGRIFTSHLAQFLSPYISCVVQILSPVSTVDQQAAQ